MKRSAAASKVAHINSGGFQKIQIVGSANQKVLHQKDGKYTVTEKKKIRGSRSSKKKENFCYASIQIRNRKRAKF